MLKRWKGRGWANPYSNMSERETRVALPRHQGNVHSQRCNNHESFGKEWRCFKHPPERRCSEEWRKLLFEKTEQRERRNEKLAFEIQLCLQREKGKSKVGLKREKRKPVKPKLTNYSDKQKRAQPTETHWFKY